MADAFLRQMSVTSGVDTATVSFASFDVMLRPGYEWKHVEPLVLNAIARTLRLEGTIEIHDYTFWQCREATKRPGLQMPWRRRVASYMLRYVFRDVGITTYQLRPPSYGGTED
jgi:hypothetical protein